MIKPRLQPKKGDLILWPKNPDFTDDEDFYYLLLEDAVRENDGYTLVDYSTGKEEPAVEVWKIHSINLNGSTGYHFLYDEDHWINLSNPLDKPHEDD